MRIEYDPEKRARTYLERGLDFLDAAHVFEGQHFTAPDLRKKYGETRYITIGWLGTRLVVFVWTPRGGDVCRVISMRKANEREQTKYAKHLA